MVYFYHIPLAKWYVVFTIPELWNWQALAFAILTPLIGLCVWTVHRWAYLALIAFTALVLVNNIVVGASGRGVANLAEQLALFAGLALLILIEVRKEFYAPYFNPRLRWWEQAQRYLTDRIRVRVKEFGTNSVLFEANSFDISATGIYVVSGHPVKPGDVFGMDVHLPGGKKSYVTGEVVWMHGGNDRNPQGFGCRFTAMDRHFKAEIRSAIRALHAGIRDH
jgi:hypothetical protein